MTMFEAAAAFAQLNPELTGLERAFVICRVAFLLCLCLGFFVAIETASGGICFAFLRWEIIEGMSFAAVRAYLARPTLVECMTENG